MQALRLEQSVDVEFGEAAATLGVRVDVQARVTHLIAFKSDGCTPRHIEITDVDGKPHEIRAEDDERGRRLQSFCHFPPEAEECERSRALAAGFQEERSSANEPVGAELQAAGSKARFALVDRARSPRRARSERGVRSR